MAKCKTNSDFACIVYFELIQNKSLDRKLCISMKLGQAKHINCVCNFFVLNLHLFKRNFVHKAATDAWKFELHCKSMYIHRILK
jgi:hypothetical protein